MAMGENTKIQWCHFTFNPWIGCAKVSPGCKHCYAEVQTYPRVSKARGLPLWGQDAARHVTSTWKDPPRWNREAAEAGERRRVFCASLADVFEDRDDLRPHRARLADLVRSTPHLDWLLLTKRPENATRLWADAWADSWNGADSLGFEWPPNIWIGTTVEDQARADERIPHLLRVPARVRFLSCEPLLGQVNVRAHMSGYDGEENCQCLTRSQCPRHAPPRVDWIIIGGESGPKARQFDVAWARDLIRQCRAAGAPVFVKQLGPHPIDGYVRTVGGNVPRGFIFRDRAGGDPSEWPEDLRVRELPR